MKKTVSLYWLVNHLVHQSHHTVSIYEYPYPYDKGNHICDWGDKYYEEHKEELLKRTVSFIQLKDNGCVICLREEK